MIFRRTILLGAAASALPIAPVRADERITVVNAHHTR